MNRSLTRAWITLAVIALLISGLLAILVTGAKIPVVKDRVDIEFIRWCLVVHVNLATLVWFTALPVGLIHMSTRARGAFAAQLSWFGFLLAAIGMVFLFSVPLQDGVKPVLSNYVPVLTHSRYYMGIAIYLLGVAIGILSPKTFVNSDQVCEKWKGLYEIRFGLLVGAVFLLLAMVAMGASFAKLSQVRLLHDKQFYELGMWGGGHLIQHASVVFIVCCWVLLLSCYGRRPILSRSQMFVVFAWLGLPAFIAPAILFFDTTSGEYLRGFTLLMQWGIAPPIIYFLGLVARRFSFRSSDSRSYLGVAFLLSAMLLIMGFVYGALIRGPDMMVPGHYHASIGAVTLAFMATSYLMLSTSEGRAIAKSVWFYGIGQMLFAGGMFVAGYYGMPRKTYGSEHIFTHWGQGFGVGMMGFGGTVALIGGIFFAVAVTPQLRLTSPFRAAKSGERVT